MQQYIVVADAARARIVRTDEAFEEVAEVADLTHPTGRAKAGEIVTDMNTTSTRPQGPRNQTEPVDLHHVESERFARQIAARLQKDRAAGAFDVLILVAPPKFLGVLREALDAPTARLVIGSVDRDYTLEPIDVVLDGVRRNLSIAAR